MTPSHHKNEVKTVREILADFGDTHRNHAYDFDNGVLSNEEYGRSIITDIDEAEAAINAHIVRELEILKTNNNHYQDGEVALFDHQEHVPMSAIDELIAKYKTKAQGETKE